MRAERAPEFLPVAWGAPAAVRARMSTRRGGSSRPPFDGFNLGTDPADAHAVANRARFAAALGARPVWLHQVHGTEVAVLDARVAEHARGGAAIVADAAVTATAGIACMVRVADCLPVLFASANGRAVGAAHAGWRGLAGGVLERTAAQLAALSGEPIRTQHVWLGPCIGADAFEVGADVLRAFGADDGERGEPAGARSVPGAVAHASSDTWTHTPPHASEHAPTQTSEYTSEHTCEHASPRAGSPHHPAGALAACFRRADRADGSRRWRTDLLGLARLRLAGLGITRISGGAWCTASDASAFFSFRRDGAAGPTGRMAAGIALA